MSYKSTYIEMVCGTWCGTRYDLKQAQAHQIKALSGGKIKNETWYRYYLPDFMYVRISR